MKLSLFVLLIVLVAAVFTTSDVSLENNESTISQSKLNANVKTFFSVKTGDAVMQKKRSISYNQPKGGIHNNYDQTFGRF
jgi:hypothetical protein